MTSRLFVLLLGSAIVAGCATPADNSTEATSSASTAASQTQTAAASTDSNANSDSEMICRREIVTGSNFRREVCMTRAQRREIHGSSREQAVRSRNSNTGESGPGQ